ERPHRELLRLGVLVERIEGLECLRQLVLGRLQPCDVELRTELVAGCCALFLLVDRGVRALEVTAEGPRERCTVPRDRELRIELGRLDERLLRVLEFSR